jgi:hypothetical protein
MKIAAFIILSTIFISCGQNETSKDAALQKEIQAKLQIAADQVNEQCPVMTDEGTRCDSAGVPALSTFQYNFTLINIHNKADADTVGFKSNILPGIVETFKTSPKTKLFRDDNITVVSTYRDTKGNFVFKYSISPKDYK